MGLGLWKLLYLDGKSFTPDPAKSAEINRGAYLIEGPGHCAECHSPRDVLGGIVPGKRFAGGPKPRARAGCPTSPRTPTASRGGRQGLSPPPRAGPVARRASVGNEMADVVANTAKLKPEDRIAMAAYIKSLPPRPGRAPKK